MRFEPNSSPLARDRPGSKNSLLAGEELVFLIELVDRLPRNHAGKRVHKSTLVRWRERGLLGVRLEAVRLGGRWMSSFQALDRFIAGVTAARTAAERPMPRSRRSTPVIDRELDQEGL